MQIVMIDHEHAVRQFQVSKLRSPHQAGVLVCGELVGTLDNWRRSMLTLVKPKVLIAFEYLFISVMHQAPNLGPNI